MRKEIIRIFCLSFLVALSAGGSIYSVAGEKDVELPDSVATDSVVADTLGKKPGLIKRVIDYFGKANVPRTDGKLDISFIGGPHYSSDVGLGIAVLATGHYGMLIDDSLHCRMMQSDVSTYVDISTTGFIMFGFKGTHVFPCDKRRFVYDLDVANFPNKYWGIGYHNGENNDNYSKYDEVSLKLGVQYLFRFGKHIFIGPSLDFSWVNANKIENPEKWYGEKEHVVSLGFGGVLSYDSRDNMTAPNTGVFAVVQPRIYPSFAGNGSNHFFIIDGSINKYMQVWRKGVLAMRLHGGITWGNTPWCMMPTFGKGGDMRGYYAGQYRDQNEMNVTVELRQNIWHRSGAVVWAGAGTVFSRLSEVTFRHVLPNFGIGYRWEFKKNSNVRVDFGIGRGQTGFVFNINEAF